VLFACTRNLEYVGYGTDAPLQDGLEVRLIHNGPESALLQVTNASAEIISLNQSPLAVRATVLGNGKPLVPAGFIMFNDRIDPYPDAFVILAPGQSHSIPLRIGFTRGRYHAGDKEYALEKDVIYTVAVQIEPYFGTFQKDNAEQTLAKLRIPNYRHQPLQANTMTLRLR